LARWFYCKSLT